MAARKSKLPAGIRKLRDGRYRLDVTDATGHRYRLRFDTLKEAEARKAIIDGQKMRGQLVTLVRDLAAELGETDLRKLIAAPEGDR